jgi:hypothetical protein
MFQLRLSPAAKNENRIAPGRQKIRVSKRKINETAAREKSWPDTKEKEQINFRSAKESPLHTMTARKHFESLLEWTSAVQSLQCN